MSDCVKCGSGDTRVDADGLGPCCRQGSVNLWPRPGEGDGTRPIPGQFYIRRNVGANAHAGRTAQVMRIDKRGNVVWRYIGNKSDQQPTAVEFFNARFVARPVAPTPTEGPRG